MQLRHRPHATLNGTETKSSLWMNSTPLPHSMTSPVISCPRTSPGGPLLLEDHYLIEKLAHFERERIPERVVHAKGWGAYGYFEVTADVTRWTKAKFLSPVGKRTELFVRFSTVAGEKGYPDTVRDPRGFAIKLYTEEGNYDLVCNNTPIFFIRDTIKFPDFIHSQKRDPRTGRQEPDNVWDFFSLSPEMTHMFTWLYGDRGIPASFRQMDGFGGHTFQWVNAKGEAFWVKYHFKTDQGIKCLSAEEAASSQAGTPTITGVTCFGHSSGVSTRHGRSRCRSCPWPRRAGTASTHLI